MFHNGLTTDLQADCLHAMMTSLANRGRYALFERSHTEISGHAKIRVRRMRMGL